MSGSVISLAVQWSLNETVDGCYKISKDIVHAATNDNVQTGTLYSLDKFGATLAICPETGDHVEQQLRLARGSRVVEFIKARIGFVRGDSCEALSKSTGGIRYLSLAATLATLDSHIAATATREMMEASSPTGHALPTLGQLRDIHAALDYKMHRLSFVDKIVQWQEWESKHLLTRRSLQSQQALNAARDMPCFGRDSGRDAHPQSKVIASLVSALREVYRLGQGSFVRISGGSYGFAWLAAFCEWCTGAAPTIILPEGYESILSNDLDGNPRVLFLYAGSPTGSTIVEVSSHINSLTCLCDVGRPVDHETWSGMASMAQYGRRVIEAWGLDTELGLRALSQALVYSTTEVISTLPFFSQDIRNQNENPRNSKSLSDPMLKYFSQRVTSTICQYLGTTDKSAYATRVLQEGQGIRDLSSVRQHSKDLEEQCACSSCGDDSSSLYVCLVSEFEYCIAHITAQILALSLFELVEPVKLLTSASTLPRHNPMQFNTLVVKIIQILDLTSIAAGTLRPRRSPLESKPSITLHALFDLGLHLIGHDVKSPDKWIASVGRGQVVFAYFFENRQFKPDSIAIIDGGPGTIMYGDERYSLVQGGSEESKLGPPPMSRLGPKNAGMPKVDRIQNFLGPHHVKLNWEVTAQANCLRLMCNVSGGKLQGWSDPTNALRIASASRFAGSCLHDPLAVLDSPDKNAFYDFFPSKNNHLKDSVVVIALHGNDDMRFASLTSEGLSQGGIIRQNACLQCCLDLCRRERLHFVLL